MARILPARGAWPDLSPEATCDSGLPHLDQTVERVVEEHNALMAYWGAGHYSQSYCRAGGVSAILVKVAAPIAAATYATVLRPLTVMRTGMGVAILYFLVTSDNGGIVRLSCLDTATNNTTAVAAGTQYGFVQLALARGDLLTRLTVDMQFAAGGIYINLLAFSLCDDDLAAGTLP